MARGPYMSKNMRCASIRVHDSSTNAEAHIGPPPQGALWPPAQPIRSDVNAVILELLMARVSRLTRGGTLAQRVLFSVSYGFRVKTNFSPGQHRRARPGGALVGARVEALPAL